MAETSTKNINNSFTVSDQDGRAATRKWIHVDTLDDLVHCFPSSGDHSFSQTDAVRREQEGNGGLDRRSQVRPEVGNLRGEQLVSSFIHPAPDAVIQNLVFDPFFILSSPPQASQFNMEHFSGMHNWYACSHARPTFCNVCREALPGVTSHGLSCEGTRASTR